MEDMEDLENLFDKIITQLHHVINADDLIKEFKEKLRNLQIEKQYLQDKFDEIPDSRDY